MSRARTSAIYSTPGSSTPHLFPSLHLSTPSQADPSWRKPDLPAVQLFHTSTPASHHHTCSLHVRMKEVSASQGLMLDSISSRLVEPDSLPTPAPFPAPFPAPSLHLPIPSQDEGSECESGPDAGVHFKPSHGTWSASPQLPRQGADTATGHDRGSRAGGGAFHHR